MKKLLIVGFGNEFRRDDGLGIKLLDQINENVDKLKVQELSIDLVDILKEYDIVLFVDASIEGGPISFKKIEKEEKFSPLTHHLTCEELLFWIDALYKRSPEFYLLSIRGYDFDFGEELSEKARENLDLAKKFVQNFINETISNKLSD